jgi:hypothetical protein
MRIKEQDDVKFDMVKVKKFQHDEDEAVSSEGSDEFLRGLGFKDPFHKELMSTEGTDQDIVTNIPSSLDIKPERMKYPLKQYMTQEKVKQVNNLLQNKQEYSTILANLLFSANNPF